jgi:uncharacterized MAPEG superfamily protein
VTLAYYCVLVAALLPYVAAYIAKSRRDFDNADPRGWLAKQQGFRARANAAQANSFEAFPFFAVAVIVAHLRDGPQTTIDMLAIGFVVARLAYLTVYVAGFATVRSLVWLVGLICTIALFFVG